MSYLEAEYLPYHVKMIPFLFSHIGIFTAYQTTSFLAPEGVGVQKQNAASPYMSLAARRPTSFQKNVAFYEFHTWPVAIRIYRFFNQKWHFDDSYNRFIVQKVLTFGYRVTFRLFDAG